MKILSFINISQLTALLKVKEKFKQDDNRVVDFLIDLNIALGYEYNQPERELFAPFSPYFRVDPYQNLSLSSQLAQAYKSLKGTKKTDAHRIIRKALYHCAKSPIGIKRSLTCLDLAHEIEAALITEKVNIDLMFRYNNRDELAIWLLQLVHRWKEWNIKVEANSQYWEKAIKAIEPKGLLTLLFYVFDNNLNEQFECCFTLCKIARKRIKKDNDIFIDVGQAPALLEKQISKLEKRIRDHCIKTDNLNSQTTEGLYNLTAGLGVT